MTSLRQVRHASPPHALERERATKIAVGSGKKLLRRLQLLNPAMSSWKIQLASCLLTREWHTKVSVLDWRLKGTKSRPLLYLHQRSGHGTDEIESGLLPTLQAHDKAKGNAERVGRFGTKHGGRNLNDEVAGLLPTLTAGNITGGNTSRSGNRKDELLLPGIIRGLAPTLSARDWKDTPGMASEGTNPDGTHRDRTDQLPRVIGICTGYRLSARFAAWFLGYPQTIFESETEQNGSQPSETP